MRTSIAATAMRTSTAVRTSIAVTAIGLCANAAAASPCGGDTSDSSDSFSSFSSSSDDSYVAAPSPPCEGPCADYREWQKRNAPTVFLEFGVVTRTLLSPLGTETGTVTHDMESFSYRVVGPASQPAAPLEHAVVAQVRMRVPLRHHFYVAGEVELGGLTSSGVAAEMTSSGELGAPTLTASSTVLAGGVGVLGFGGRLGAVDLGVEVAGGGRVLAYTYDSTYLSCETTSSIMSAAPVLEGRARASVWLSPHVMLSALAGKSALDDGMMGGFTIGLTNHAFGRR